MCGSGGYFDKAFFTVGPSLFTVSPMITLLALKVPSLCVCTRVCMCVRACLCVHFSMLSLAGLYHQDSLPYCSVGTCLCSV